LQGKSEPLLVSLAVISDQASDQNG
jgi:hypothetical protein